MRDEAKRPTERFSDRAADYARHRPSYPIAALRAARDGLRSAESVAADVGSGTGISARLLADLGMRVFAIEPNAAMRQAAVPHPRVEWRDGMAEATGLPGRSVDLVLCAQSFHWFDATDALAEFRRILRPGGRMAMMWNERDETDPFTAAYGRLVIEAARGDPAADRTERPAALRTFQRLDFPHAQILDEAGLLGRARSSSYLPKHGPAAEALFEALRALHRRFRGPEGTVPLVYQTELYLSDVGDG